MRVSEAARDRLEALAELVKRRPGQVVEILSHADVATLLECEARRVLERDAGTGGASADG